VHDVTPDCARSVATGHLRPQPSARSSKNARPHNGYLLRAFRFERLGLQVYRSVLFDGDETR
jgi:hypothetical protein